MSSIFWYCLQFKHFPLFSSNRTPIKGADLFQCFPIVAFDSFSSWPHYEGQSLNANVIGDSSNSQQLSQYFHIYLIVVFTIKGKWHWVILLNLYNLSSIFTFSTLLGSLLNENSIGVSSNFLQLLQHFHISHIVGSIIEWK